MSRINVTLYNKEGTEPVGINPATVASQVEIASETGTDSTVEAEIIELRRQVAALVSGGASFKGTVTQSKPLPTVAYKAGWQYVVAEPGTYAGQEAEEGEMFLAVRDYASGSASNKDWTLLQVNISGVVKGPASSVVNNVAVFDGTTGKVLKDSGFSIAKSVPADAEFTDTRYSAATSQADGLMTAAQFSKLGGIESGADKTDADNVAAAGAVMKSGSSDDLKQGSTNLYMTSAERAKLDGISAGAQPNQNAFSNVKFGGTTISADTTTDTLELAAGEGVTIELDEGADKVTFSETYIDSCMVTSLSKVPANLRNGGLIILKQ